MGHGVPWTCSNQETSYSSLIIKSNYKSNKCLHGFTCALSIYYTSKKSNMCNQQFLRLVAWDQIYRMSLRIRYGLRCSHGFSYRWLSRSRLVGGFNPSEKYESWWEGLSHILWKNMENKKCSKPPISTYCGWKKSCTTWDGWNPSNNGINHISTGAGFLPSTVCSAFFGNTRCQSWQVFHPPQIFRQVILPAVPKPQMG